MEVAGPTWPGRPSARSSAPAKTHTWTGGGPSDGARPLPATRRETLHEVRGTPASKCAGARREGLDPPRAQGTRPSRGPEEGDRRTSKDRVSSPSLTATGSTPGRTRVAGTISGLRGEGSYSSERVFCRKSWDQRIFRRGIRSQTPLPL